MPAKQKLKNRSLRRDRIVHDTHSSFARRLHLQRAAWFAVLLIGLLFIQIAYNWHGGQPHVLGYRSQITHDELLESSNHARLANGLSSLKQNDRLAVAAQLKADDMISKNYWNHTAPDGSPPWKFFQKVGYNYQTAGENLAYGFASSNEVITAWLNSAEHRENVLGSYNDIGFGVAHGTDYQGEDTIVVVAMYGTPASGTAVLGQHTSLGQPQHIIGATVVANGGANWAVYASLGLVVASAFGFLITHLELLRYGWYRSRHFMAVHPAIDALVIITICVLLLTAASGFIR